jgi:hypothetical protein
MTVKIPKLPEYRKSGGMSELYSEVEVHAIPERIWGILSDFSEISGLEPVYPEYSGHRYSG